MMKRDIESREDIETLLEAFYQQATQDPLIGRFFTEVVQLDIQQHIPVIAGFWEAILFGHRTYGKNVMEVHQHIHQLSSIKKEHLDRWVHLFTQTVDRFFEGEKAMLMKQRGASIATLMDIKLNYNQINPKQ
jgi:hemoglobin